MNSSAKYSAILPSLAIVVACGTAGFVAARAIWSEPLAEPSSAAAVPAAGSTIPPGSVEPERAGKIVASTAPGDSSPSQHAAPVSASLEKLRAALADDDILRGAAAALAWLEASTLEDQRAVLAPPKDFFPPNKPGLGAEFYAAFFDAFTERWLSRAPDDFKLLFNSRDFWPFQDSLARLRPELVLAEVFQSASRNPYRSETITALESLAERNPAAAQAFLEKVPEASLRLNFQEAIVRGMAQTDVFAAAAQLPAQQSGGSDYAYMSTVAAIVETAERGGPGILRRLFAETGAKLEAYPNLPRLLMRYPDLRADFAEREGGNSRGYISRQIDAETISPEAREAILADYEHFPVQGRDAIASVLVDAWARTDPRAAADWGLAHAKPDEVYGAANWGVRSAFSQWVRNDPAAAIAWWEQLPDSVFRSGLGTTMSTRLADRGDFASALKLFRTVSDASLDDSTQHLAQLYATHDPAAAAAWVATMPAGSAAEHAAPIVARGLYQSDPDAATSWLESLPAGKVRDRAVEQFVTSASIDPAGAAERIERIGDPELRAKATRSLALDWEKDDPPAARAWVEKQPGLDANWRAHFLRQ